MVIRKYTILLKLLEIFLGPNNIKTTRCSYIGNRTFLCQHLSFAKSNPGYTDEPTRGKKKKNALRMIKV